MRVWIINPYGNLPGEAWREYRSSMLASALERAGHDVVWWISNFEHRSKKFRSSGWKDRRLSDRISVHIVPSISYRQHISLRRIAYEIVFARRVAARAIGEVRPDAIILAEPALFVAPGIIQLCKRFDCKLIVDVLDLWPELFKIALPRALSPFHRIIFYPLYARRSRLFRAADAIVSVSKDYDELVRSIVPGKPTHVAYLGVDVMAFRNTMQNDEQDVCSELGLAPKYPEEMWVIYAGTLGDGYDIRTILSAIQTLSASGMPVRFLIAGDGPAKAYLFEHGVNKMHNATYLGVLDSKVLTRLYRHCDVGLSTYVADSTVSMPVKLYDYLAAGLAIINSLGREVGEIIKVHGAGIEYAAGNPASLVDAIVYLSNNPMERLQMRCRSTDLAYKFDSISQHNQYAKFISSL